MAATPPPINYAHVFGEDYRNAQTFMQQQKALTTSILQKDRLVLEAALFPEVIRYSQVKDLLETSALEMLYVQYGAGYADFSIGRFQMKPSFAEAVETYLAAHPALDASLATALICPQTPQGRASRVARLKQVSWQLRYARAFYLVVCHKFALSPATTSDHVRFVAAAYNSGFLRTETEIRKWAETRAFPYGPRYSGTQYAYADIAVDYYQHQISSFSP